MDNSKEEGQDELSSLKQTIAKLTQEINELKGTILKKDAQLTVVKDKEVQIRRIAKKYKDSYFNLKALDDQREAEIASIFLDQAVAATDARNRVAADHDLVALENQLEAKMKNFFEDPYKLEIMAQLGEENETVKTAFDHLYRQFQQQQASKPSTSSGTVETSSMGRKRWIEDESSSSLGPAPKILVTDADDKNVTIEMDVKDDEPGANNEISSGQDDNQDHGCGDIKACTQMTTNVHPIQQATHKEDIQHLPSINWVAATSPRGGLMMIRGQTGRRQRGRGRPKRPYRSKN